MVLKLLLVLFVCIGVYGSPQSRQDAFELTKRVLEEYLNSGKRPLYLDYALKNYQLPHIFRSNADPRAVDDSICVLCQLVANIFIQERKAGMTEVQLGAEAYYFCTTLGIENPRVCDGLVHLNAGIFMQIVDRNPNVDGQKVCGLLLQINDCSKGDNYDWTIDIPEGKTIEKPQATGSNSFNILQISDVHYDPLYTPGVSSKCGEPLCCQADQVPGTDETNSCGYWTDYSNADIPLHTVHETFSQTTTHNFDYVYYTGDFVSHRVWATSVESNTKDIITITDLFRSYYGGVPVYPILGNHEPHPVNLWSSEGETDKTLSSQWLFDLVAEQWSDWLPEDARQTILKGGYYTLSPRNRFRIIALNSNVCYTVNWWLINEDKDPYGQLAWLAETLTKAENNKESVHILSHLPTGNSGCLEVWSREYSKIIERFANTITAQFNGHTHKDEFSIYYSSSNPKRPINTAWNGASITSFTDCNPSYKLFQIDDETLDVLDYEEWTFNLTLANSDPDQPLPWYKLYSFKDAYGVNSLQPNELDKLVHRMTENHSLIDKYYNYKFRNSDVVVNSPCDDSCQRDILCEITTTVYGETDVCEGFQVLYDESK